MRATEALELSNPDNDIDIERKMRITHLEYSKNWDEIIAARARNRKKRAKTLWDRAV